MASDLACQPSTRTILANQILIGAELVPSERGWSTLPTRQPQGLDSVGQAQDMGASAENDDVWHQEASFRPQVIDGLRSGIHTKDGMITPHMLYVYLIFF